MAAIKIQAELRTEFGKGAARRARREGKIPGVIYGHGADPVHVLLPAHETTLAVRGSNALLEILVDGGSHLTLAKDIQRDVILQSVDHLDLLIVKRGEKVEVEISVILEGEAAPGSVVNLETQLVSVQAEATHLPESIVFSIEGREVGEHVHASDLVVPKGVDLLTDAETVIATISEPQAVDLGESEETEAAEGEAEEAAEASEEAAE